jgi:phosphate transport system permease protein
MRRASDFIVPLVTGACALLAAGILVGLVTVVAMRGGPAMDWAFLTQQIRAAGSEGGIFWNLVGTSILLAAAFVICAPLAIALALLERVWLPPGRLRSLLQGALFTMNGLPSILFGIFGFIVFVKGLGWGKSWLIGGIVLALSMLPTVTVSLIERLKAVPSSYAEAATALGMTRTQIVWSVLLPQSWNGLITGSLLGLARAAGETAPIMFTCTIFAGATWPPGIKESPVLTLPYHIFILAQDSFDPETGSKLWGAALVLLGLVLLLSLIALPGRLKIHEEANG